MAMKLFLALILVLCTNFNSFGESIEITGNFNKAPKIGLENNVPKGILVDIMEYVGNEMGIDFTITLFPWRKAFSKAKDGKSGIVGISKTIERLQWFDYSEVLYYDEVILVVKKGHEFPFENFEDLKGKRIGVCKDCSYGFEYEEAKKHFLLNEDYGNQHRLKNLISGRIDAAVFSPGAPAFKLAIASSDSLKLSDFSILPKSITKDPNFLAFAKSQEKTEFIKRFNSALKAAHASGAIQKIVDRY